MRARTALLGKNGTSDISDYAYIRAPGGTISGATVFLDAELSEPKRLWQKLMEKPGGQLKGGECGGGGKKPPHMKQGSGVEGGCHPAPGTAVLKIVY